MADHLGITTPYFGILVSLIPYIIAQYFYKKTNGFFLLAPLFVAMVAGIVFLKVSVINSLPLLSQHPILIILLIIISTLLLLVSVGYVSQLFVTKTLFPTEEQNEKTRLKEEN